MNNSLKQIIGLSPILHIMLKLAIFIQKYYKIEIFEFILYVESKKKAII
jgi:hypothetical protein